MTQGSTDTNGERLQFCEEKWRLSEAFTEASQEILDLQSQQMRAVIEQDPDFARFDDLLQMARDKKNRAKYALIAHIERHQC